MVNRIAVEKYFHEYLSSVSLSLSINRHETLCSNVFKFVDIAVVNSSLKHLYVSITETTSGRYLVRHSTLVYAAIKRNKVRSAKGESGRIQHVGDAR